jgi:hypothetical protein
MGTKEAALIRLRALVLCLCSVFLTHAPVYAATYYVDQTAVLAAQVRA